MLRPTRARDTHATPPGFGRARAGCIHPSTNMPPLRGSSVSARFTMSIPANYGVFHFWQLFFDANSPNDRNTFNLI